jgi:hypothetical protein
MTAPDPSLLSDEGHALMIRWLSIFWRNLVKRKEVYLKRKHVITAAYRNRGPIAATTAAGALGRRFLKTLSA